MHFEVTDGPGVNNALRKRPSSTTVVVQSTTIDSFAANNPPPDILMIDIEGAEIEALSGGLLTIAEYRPTVLVEVHWLGERFLKFVDTHLRPLGYEATTYDGQPLPREPVRYHCLLQPTGTPTSAAPDLVN